MDKKNWLNSSYKSNLIISGLLAVVMFLFITFAGGSVGIAAEHLTVTAVLFALTYLGALVYLSLHSDFEQPMTFFYAAAATAALIYMRVSLLPTFSPDYDEFLMHWLAEMRTYDLGGAIAANIGDYNTPYLYFLAIISRFNFNDLILIKWLSCCFDVVLAVFAMRTVALFTKNGTARVLSFIVTLAAPTVLLNSAHWGQCDSIFAAFCVASLYYCLRDKGRAAVIMFAVAFTIKIQAIFILPALIACFFIGKINWRDAVWFPAVFVAAILPAIICGRPIADTVGIYFNQAGSYDGRLVLNAPSFYQLFGSVDFDAYSSMAIMLAGAAAVTLLFVLYQYRDRLTSDHLVLVFLLSALIIPYFLPKMHDRYFYVADVLSIIYFFTDKRRWYVPLTVIFASFVSYSAYILGGALIDQKYTAFSLLVIIIVLARELVCKLAAAPTTMLKGDTVNELD